MTTESVLKVSDIFREITSSLEQPDQGFATKMAAEAEEQTVDFSQAWDFSDIVFVVEDKKLHASKLILSMWSPVFKAMFRDNFREKDAKEVELPGKNYDDVCEMLQVLHPPNKDICGDNVTQLLPLAQEYQMDRITERCEDFLMSQACTIKNYMIAQKFGLTKLEESNLAYMKRAPVYRLKSQNGFDELDKEMLQELLVEKCEKFEINLESLRELRMVLERKKPTTFPGMHLLCETCTSAREQQVDCTNCMKACCKRLVEIIRNIDR